MEAENEQILHNLCTAQQPSALFQPNGCTYCMKTLVYIIVLERIAAHLIRFIFKNQTLTMANLTLS